MKLNFLLFFAFFFSLIAYGQKKPRCSVQVSNQIVQGDLKLSKPDSAYEINYKVPEGQKFSNYGLMTEVNKTWNSIFETSKKNSKSAFKWNGPDLPRSLAATDLEPSVRLSHEYLANEESNGGSAIEVVLQLWSQIFFEEGRRIAIQDSSILTNLIDIRNNLKNQNFGEALKITQSIKEFFTPNQLEKRFNGQLDLSGFVFSDQISGPWPLNYEILPIDKMFSEFKRSILFYVDAKPKSNSVDLEKALKKFFDSMFLTTARYAPDHFANSIFLDTYVSEIEQNVKNAMQAKDQVSIKRSVESALEYEEIISTQLANYR